jgi:hypothetical protein
MYGDWENLFPPRGRLKILREINLSVPWQDSGVLTTFIHMYIVCM